MNDKALAPLVLLLLLGLFAYLARNNFELPFLLSSKTQQVFGKVAQTYDIRNYTNSNQNVKYTYKVSGTTYFDFAKTGNSVPTQIAGNRVLVEYSESNAQESRVVSFFKDYEQSLPNVFHTNEPIGYSEVSFVNGIFSFIKYGGQGEEVDQYYGEYDVANDTINMTPFEDNRTPQTFKFDTTEYTQIIDCKTNMLFTQ